MENILFIAPLRLNLCLLTYVMSQTPLIPSPRLKTLLSGFKQLREKVRWDKI